MNKEQIADSVASKLALSAEWSELERLRLIDVSLESHVNSINQDILSMARRKGDVKTARFENFKLILACSQRIDELQGEVQLKPTEATHATAAPEANEKGVEAVQEHGSADAVSGAAEQVEFTTPKGEKVMRDTFPCHLCEDSYFHKVDLVKHLRINHGLSMEEAVKSHPVTELKGGLPDFQTAPARSICADCLGDCTADGTPRDPHPKMTACTGHNTRPDEFQINWRDSTCQEWRTCPFTAKCFGPSNEEDPTCFKEDKIRELGTVALESLPVDPHREQHAKLVAERRAAGDDINDSGVFLNPEVLTIPIPPKAKHTAEIRIAATADGQFCYGYNFQCRAVDSIEGSSSAASISGPFHASRNEAILAALAFLTSRWPNKKIPGRKAALECVNAYYMEIIKAEAVEITPKETPNETQQETPADTANGDGGAVAPTHAADAETLDIGDNAPINYTPLDEPIGDCDLCQGYGVVEDELDDFNMVPCSCEAGKLVAGKGIPDDSGEPIAAECCKNCHLGDPDCDSCMLPDQELSFPDRLKAAQQNPCTHPMDQHKDQDGATVCGVCGYVLRPAEKVCGNGSCAKFDDSYMDNCGIPARDRKMGPIDAHCTAFVSSLDGGANKPIIPEPTDKQKTCKVHLSGNPVFLTDTPEGKMCKACKLILPSGGGQGLSAIQPRASNG